MIDEQKQLEKNLEGAEELGKENSGERKPQMNQEGDSIPVSNDPVAASEPSSVNLAEEEIQKQPDSSQSETEQPNPEEVIASLTSEVELLKQQLEQQAQQADTLKKRYIGLAAEFDNFRKRTQKEKEELEVQVKCKTLGELLSVVDNFERARNQIKPGNDGEMAIHKSYQGVYKNLVESLKRLGVSAMRSEGQPFDPSYHEAMLREPTDAHPEGTVLEQLVRGYLLGDRVLRHAMVKVAAPKEPVIPSEEENIEPGDSQTPTS